MSRLVEKARFKECVSDLIADFSAPNYLESRTGAESAVPVEHVTRRHFVDPFLRALGWNLLQLNEEMIEEARVRGETTLHLDYLGINRETRVPLLIVEAKAWGAPFIAASAKQRSAEGSETERPISLLCAAIEHCKNGCRPEDSPVTLEWARYISKLYQYVTAVYDESGHVVTRVAMISGQWLVVFKDPKAIFLTREKVSSLLISVYRGEELVTYAEQIYVELAQSSISTALPEIVRPSILHAYIVSQDIKRAYRAVWVSHHTTGAHWRPRPSIDLEVAVVLERRDGALLTVVDESLEAWPRPHDYEDLNDHIASMEAESDKLLSRINAELGIALEPEAVKHFPGFRQQPSFSKVVAITPFGQTHVPLVRIARKAREFLLVTGADRHFLLREPTVDPCGGHDWALCRSSAQHYGTKPIIFRSADPKAFFRSCEAHHCAHRLIHDRRYARCQIAVFEEYLCCRGCVLQNYCWSTQELIDLPCGDPPLRP